MGGIVLAQSLGHYAGAGGGNIVAEWRSAAQDGANWLQHSFREDLHLWIAALVCLVLGMRVFGRR